MNKNNRLPKRIFVLALAFVSIIALFACSNSISSSGSSSNKLGAYYYTEGSVLHLTGNSNYESIPYKKSWGELEVSWKNSFFDIAQIDEVIIDGDIYFDSDKECSAEKLFGDLKNVIRIEGLKKLHIKGSASSLFWYNEKLTTLDIEDLDTSEITNMSAMFNSCERLESLEIRKWNTSKVKYMHMMFNGCNELKTLYIGKWNTGNVVNMSSMFWGCEKLTKLDISNWNTRNVEDMGWMFNSCEKLASLDIGKWNTSNVKDMNSMFRDCKNLTELNIDKWNVKKVEDMKEIFDGCDKLSKVPSWY